MTRTHGLVIAKAALLVIIAVTPMAAYYLSSSLTAHALTESFKVIIDRDVIPFNSFVVSAATLNIPGVQVGAPKVTVGRQFVTLTFNLPGDLESKALAGPHYGYPAVVVVISDYSSGRSLSMILTSNFIVGARIAMGESKIDLSRASAILAEDPLAALRGGSFIVSKSIFLQLQTLGLAAVHERVAGLGIPLTPWEEAELETLKASAKDSTCEALGFQSLSNSLYYRVASSSPAAREPMPSWWAKRTDGLGEERARQAWARFRERLAAAEYLVPVGYDLNRAIEEIASYALGERQAPASLYDMDSFLGGGWRDTFGARLIYEGLLPLLEVRTEGPSDVYSELFADVRVGTYTAAGWVSGIVVDGLYFSVLLNAGSGIDLAKDIIGLANGSFYVYAPGAVFSQGDYLVVAWRIAGPVECGGDQYYVVFPNPVIVPLYSISLNASKLVASREPIDTITPLGSGRLTPLESFAYSRSNYTGALQELCECNMTSIEASPGYQVFLGMPAYSFVLSVYSGSRDAYSEMASSLARLLLGTGYVSSDYRLQGAYIAVGIYTNQDPGDHAYQVTLYRSMPQGYRGGASGSPLWGLLAISAEPLKAGG